MAPVHAPMNTHSGYDGSCVSCPWPLHEAETPEGITRAVFESIDVDDLAEFFFGAGWNGPYPQGSYAQGSRIWLAYEQATAIKAHLLKRGA